MKTFRQLREKLNRQPSGQMVFNKKMDRIPESVHKEKSGFVVYIDGDRLDAYKTHKEAENMAKQFVKTYKG